MQLSAVIHTTVNGWITLHVHWPFSMPIRRCRPICMDHLYVLMVKKLSGSYQTEKICHPLWYIGSKVISEIGTRTSTTESGVLLRGSSLSRSLSLAQRDWDIVRLRPNNGWQTASSIRTASGVAGGDVSGDPPASPCGSNILFGDIGSVN
jgi:hypothetical protein